MRTENRDRAVDGLRGVTLLVIVTTHFIPSAFFSFNIPKPASAVLFVVAGYFLMAILLRNSAALDSRWPVRARTMANILVMRHIRIWPVLAIVIGLYALMGAVFPDRITTQIFHTWPLYLSYLGNIPKILYGGTAFPPQFWVVSAQEQMIAMYAVLILAIGLTRANRLLPLFVFTGIVGRAIMCVLFMPANPALALETPVSATDALALGMVARLAVEQQISRNVLKRMSFTAALVLILLWSALPNTFALYFTITPLIVAMLSAALIVLVTDPLREHRLERGLLAYPPFVFIGQMSLTLFFTHPLVLTLMRLIWADYTGTLLTWWQIAIAGPILSLMFAFVFFEAVEAPIRRWRKHRGAPKPAGVRTRNAPPNAAPSDAR